jgi:hypothetical protein
MHVGHKVFQAHLLHGDFIPEQIHDLDAYVQLSDISQRILLLIFQIDSIEFDGIEKPETDAFKGSFGIYDWFDLFDCKISGSLLHGRDAKDHEQYDI